MAVLATHPACGQLGPPVGFLFSNLGYGSVDAPVTKSLGGLVDSTNYVAGVAWAVGTVSDPNSLTPIPEADTAFAGAGDPGYFYGHDILYGGPGGPVTIEVFYWNKVSPLPGVTTRFPDYNTARNTPGGEWGHSELLYLHNNAFELPYELVGLTPVTLTLNETHPGPPVITTQPVDLKVWAGRDAAFTVNAIGDKPFRFQWEFNGTTLPGATNAALGLVNVQPTNSGNYSVLVSNTNGATLSSNALLTVLEGPPIIAVQPTDQITYPGRPAAFQVVTDGPVPQSYQWRVDGMDVVGTTDTILGYSRFLVAGLGQNRKSF